MPRSSTLGEHRKARFSCDEVRLSSYVLALRYSVSHHVSLVVKNDNGHQESSYHLTQLLRGLQNHVRRLSCFAKTLGKWLQGILSKVLALLWWRKKDGMRLKIPITKRDTTVMQYEKPQTHARLNESRPHSLLSGGKPAGRNFLHSSNLNTRIIQTPQASRGCCTFVKTFWILMMRY